MTSMLLVEVIICDPWSVHMQATIQKNGPNPAQTLGR